MLIVIRGCDVTTVYILMERGEHYDGGDSILGVYANEQSAKYSCVEEHLDVSPQDVYIQEWEVQGKTLNENIENRDPLDVLRRELDESYKAVAAMRELVTRIADEVVDLVVQMQDLREQVRGMGEMLALQIKYEDRRIKKLELLVESAAVGLKKDIVQLQEKLLNEQP